MSRVALEVQGVSKVYPGTVALKNADFRVYEGAVNVLVGENGAGKSTLMKIIAGVEQPSEGKVLVKGREVHLASTDDAAKNGIGIVFQELNLFGNLSVAENIFVAREITRAGHIDHAAQERRAAEILKRLEHDIDPRTPVEDLRVGEQQIVEIAKALAQDARVLIMDEPTSALSAAEVEILFRVIADLKAQGVAIVYISHRLEELIRIGDHITVLRDGRITGHRTMENVDVPWIVRQMIGSDAKDFAKTVGHEVVGREVFRAEDICLPRASGGYAVDHVSLKLDAGEIIGIYGLMGAGRTEFFDCVMGRHPNSTGTIFIENKPITRHDVATRIRHGLALIPEDRQREGLVPILSIATNLTMASLRKFTTGFHIRRKAEEGAIQRFVKDLAIKVADPSYEVSSLSGGNQQKVVIGKALMTDPKVLLMDEPSRGIDVGAKADVFKTMRKLAADGLGILFATSDLEEVMALSDKIAVMSNGKLIRVFDRNEATEEAVIAASAQGHGLSHSQARH